MVTGVQTCALPIYEVGGADEDLGVAVVAEGVDARVLQEAPQDGAHPDVLAEALDAGAQAADAAHDDIDRHPGPRGPVEGIDDGLIDDGGIWPFLSLSDFFTVFSKVVSYDDFIKYSGWKGSQENGVLRLEGKEYIVHDGDLMEFLFNV